MTYTTATESITIHKGAKTYIIGSGKATYNAIIVNSLTLARLVVLAMRSDYKRVEV